MAWMYILECGDGSYYVGSTSDLDARIDQHLMGKGGKYTAERLPLQLAFAQEFETVDEAWAMERRVHGWSRAKKRALIDGRFKDLPDLARSRSDEES